MDLHRQRTIATAFAALLLASGVVAAQPWGDQSGSSDPQQGAAVPTDSTSGTDVATSTQFGPAPAHTSNAPHPGSPRTTEHDHGSDATPPGTPIGQTPGAASSAPAPVANFEGLHTTVDCTVPPDSDGAIGTTYWIAFVNNYNNCATQTPSGNVGFYCAAASGGSPGHMCTAVGQLAFAFYWPNLWSGVSGTCSSATAHSDPQVVYDSAHDRWAILDITTASSYQLCLAVSETNDPINGNWCVISIAPHTNTIADYEKMGIWGDGFYVGYNPTGEGGSSVDRVLAVNRADAESCGATNGGSVRAQDFTYGSDTSTTGNDCGSGTINHRQVPLPATYNINTGVPAVGEPEFIVGSWCSSNAIYVSTLAVNWTNSASSVLTTAKITVQTTSEAPATVAGPGDSPQTLNDRLMTPDTYYKDGSGNEYLWVTKAVTGSSSSLSAVAWYNFKVLNNNAAGTTVANQNVWNPDATSRFIGAAAFDRNGDVLLQYTQTSSSQPEGVLYAGRLASDPANTLGQSETVLYRPSTYYSGSCNGTCSRWGDYGATSIAPDGCTYWFTNEYYAQTGDAWQWDTRVGATAYSSCTSLAYGYGAPTSLSWADPVGQDREGAQSLQLTNTGTGPLVLQAINKTGSTQFTVLSDTCSNTTIAAGSSCAVSIDCGTPAQGTYTGTVTFYTNVAAADSTAASLTCTVSTASLSAGSSSPGGYDGGQRGGLDPTPQGNYQ